MSFFSKLTKEFDELKAKFGDDDKPKEQSQQHTGTRGESDGYYGGANQPHDQQQSGPPLSHQGYGQQPTQQLNHSPYPSAPSPSGQPPSELLYSAPQSQLSYHAPPQQHHAPPQQYAHAPSPYGAPPGQQSPYGAPQSNYNSGASPPQFGQSTGAPICPPGWHAQFDPGSQRWYYVEHATGRTTWVAPNEVATGGYGSASTGGGPQLGGTSAGSETARDADKEKKDGGNKWLYGAGGAAAGLAGGALLMNEFGDDSDDERAAATAAAPAPAPAPTPDPYAQYGQAPPADPYTPYGQAPMGDQYDQPPAVLPVDDADGSSVSSSDREDVQDARNDYEDELADGDKSDIEEAREEYEEQHEEVYGGDSD